MATVDTSVNELIINKLTQAQYDALIEKSPTELYFVTDDSAVDVPVPTEAGKVLTSTENGVEWAEGGGTWGSITGTLSDQADLQAALDSKATTQQMEEKSTVYIVEW